MTTSQKPIDRVRLGAVVAAVWRNEDEKNPPRYSVTLERVYKDEDGEWRSATSFGRDELLTLSKVADLANSRIHELQAADRATAYGDPRLASAKSAAKER